MTTTEEEKALLYKVEDVLYPLISGIGILANVVVIFVIVIWEKYRANRNVANMFVVNLAVADLLFLLILPLHMPILIDNGWIFGGFMCKLMQVIKYINFRASISFLTLMTVDRYCAIVHSLASRSYRTRRNALKVCLLLWTVAIFISIPVMLYAGVYEDQSAPRCQVRYPGYKSGSLSTTLLYDYIEGRTSGEMDDDYDGYISGYDENTTIVPQVLESYQPLDDNVTSSDEALICIDEEHKTSTAKSGWVYANFVIFFLIPIIIILFSYVSIVRTTMTRDITSTRPGGIQFHLAVMVALLVSVFVICWMPFQVWELLLLPPGFQVGYVNDCLILKSAFEMLAWSNSAINPILYSISSRRFHDKAKVAWTYIRKGKSRALATHLSQRTTQTRLQTTVVGSSQKSLTVSAKDKNKYGRETVAPTTL